MMPGKKQKPAKHDKILATLAELRALHIDTPHRTRVAVLSGYKGMNNPGFKKATGNLKKAGLLAYGRNTIRLTDTGLAKAGKVSPPKTNAATHQRLKALLNSRIAEKLFDSMSDGRLYRRAEVAAACGYDTEESSSFVKFLGNLSSLGIVEYPKDPNDSSKRLVRLTDIAFPLGRGSEGSCLGGSYDAPIVIDGASSSNMTLDTEVSDEALEGDDAFEAGLFDHWDMIDNVINESKFTNSYLTYGAAYRSHFLYLFD